MTTKKFSLNDISINESHNIKEAMQMLNTAVYKTLFVLNSNNKLVGTITDGDIRRAVLRGLNMKSAIHDAMNKSPIFLKNIVKNQNLQSLFEKHEVTCIPIVDENMEIEKVLWKSNNIQNPIYENQVLIMAGGFGKRLGRLTDDCPKPLIDINGKPLLEVIILNFISQGFKNFTISTYYLGEKIRAYFGDGSCMGVNIDYINEENPLGTAGAISFLDPKSKKLPVIVTNGDIISNINILAALNYHSEKNLEITICQRSHFYTLPFGQIIVKNGLVSEIIEKPSTKFNVSSGIYIINYNQIDRIAKGVRIDMPDFIDVVIKNNFRVGAFSFEDYWMDIGVPENLIQAKADNLEGLI